MFNAILTFVILFLLFFFGIKGFRSLQKKEKWKLTKVLGYSIVCALVSVIFIVGFVLIF